MGLRPFKVERCKNPASVALAGFRAGIEPSGSGDDRGSGLRHDGGGTGGEGDAAATDAVGVGATVDTGDQDDRLGLVEEDRGGAGDVRAEGLGGATVRPTAL